MFRSLHSWQLPSNTSHSANGHDVEVTFSLERLGELWAGTNRVTQSPDAGLKMRLKLFRLSVRERLQRPEADGISCENGRLLCAILSSRPSMGGATQGLA